MKHTIKYIVIPFSALLSACVSSQNTNEEILREKTVFQTSQHWKPVTDIRADVAIVYGVGGNPGEQQKSKIFEERVRSWREKGYITHFMTGIAWGEYQDYFTGQWDGQMHLDEGQVTQAGDTIWHGHMVPYIVPTKNYLTYLKEKHIKRVIDAGIDAIYMEEPEFWARAGYSEAFKREWEAYYGFSWRPQHESPENTYLSNKLKYQLYYNALKEVFTYAKEYGKSKGMNIRCYVPTHSLVNYAQWKIVSPEASLASLDCVDGYIAQVWTGTSREPNYYNGVRKERVFETAFLEYGSMESMTAPTGRKMFFLTDPIEDWPRDWADYKKNYQATFTAQLFYPNINNYEVMPWPDRIYEGWYRTSQDSEEQEQIPRFYSTQMQVMVNTLNDMEVSSNRISGSQGISVLMGNSLMFQGYPEHAGYADPQLSNFYGMALPLIKRGIPVSIAHIENLTYEETLQNTRILLMSYSNMKPLDKNAHEYLAQWVKKGGILIYCGQDNDPYQTVQEWWNSAENQYHSPAEHLFEMMKIKQPALEGEYAYGNGIVYIIRQDPKTFVLEADSDGQLIRIVKNLYENKAKIGELVFKNNFYLQRGNYDLVAVLDENSSPEPVRLTGLYIDLFDPQLPIITEKIVNPGEQAFLYNIEQMNDKKTPKVLAGACRIYEPEIKTNNFSFIAKSPKNTTNVMRILLPSAVKECKVELSGGIQQPFKQTWDETSHTVFLTFENEPEGVSISLTW